MRFLILISLALAAPSALSAEPAQPYPFWDGSESIEHYAKRANLEPTKTLDLGGGVKLELVLIPAGKFVMGTEEPESPWIGGTILGITGLVALGLLAVLVTRAIRQRRRPQFSLRWLIVLVAVLGMAQHGGFRWWRAVEAWKRFDFSESPAHEVTLTNPYYIGKYEVTQGQCQQVIGSNISCFKGRDLPAEQVQWAMAQEFCIKASEKTCCRVRLLTEAEWEHACRAGTKTTYCTGDEAADLGRVAWYGRNSGKTTHAVGQKSPNAWGVYDMHGNVWEWCSDWFEPYKMETIANPQGPAKGDGRILRGGSWYNDFAGCRSAYRFGYWPNNRDRLTGFRVAVSLPGAP